MKRILYILAAVLMAVSCGEKNGGKTEELTLEQKLQNQWHSTSLAIDADIYMDFRSDNTFELYQQIGEGAHRLYRGTWNLEGDLLSGRYNDGEEWAAAYLITIEGNTLTLTSQNDAAETAVYEKEEIPVEIKETCEVVVKSIEVGNPVF